MTESTTVINEGNEGDHRYVIAEVDITSLDSAGTEPFDPSSKFNLEGAEASVLGQENGRHRFAYDPDNTQIDVFDIGPRLAQKSVDPDSQEYTGGETQIGEFDPAPDGALDPLNFNPADPTDADLSIILRAEYHDGTTTDLVDVGDGTEQTRENLLDGIATGDDGKSIRKLLVIVNNGGTAVTEDIGASTLEYMAYNADAANNADVGTVTLRFAGDFAP